MFIIYEFFVSGRFTGNFKERKNEPQTHINEGVGREETKILRFLRIFIISFF